MKLSRFLIFGFLLIQTFTQGQANDNHFPTQERLTTLMNEVMKENDLPAIVAIAINTRSQQLMYAYGNAIWNERMKVTAQHIFRMASMTKLLTSIAAMQLIERGLINLDEDLSRFLPEMSSIPIISDGKLLQPKNPITLRHLLTHTSGFGYPYTDKELSKFDRSKWEYSDLPRRFESGTQFLYGTSTDWVGRLVEKISNTDLEDYFRKNITGPLEMNRTWFNVPDSLKSYIVSKGKRGADGKQPLTELPDRIPTTIVTDYKGGSGLYSSPEDFTLLLKCMLNYGTLNNAVILQKETVLAMIQNQIGNVSMKDAGAYFSPESCCDFKGLIFPTSKYGLAWMIDTEDRPNGRKAGTVSWGEVYNTYFFIDFKSGVAASIYTQHLPFNHPQTITLFNRFSEILYSGK